MRIGEIYRQGRCGVSIEIFPPKTPDGDEGLLRTLGRLAPYRPAFISCTYGAGGTTRTRTIDWCVEIQKRFGLTATSHFTCVEATRDQMEAWLDQATQSGIGNIMALRGDPPDGRKTFEPVTGGFRYANELVAFLRQRHPEIGIGVAGYPEKHQESPDPQADLEHLKRKVEAGADAVFTQLFYENRSFFDFQDRYRKLGIQVPLIPGIMPITEFARIQRITSLCGAKMPVDLAARLEAVRDDTQAQFEIGVEHAVNQCRELVEAGVPGIHFYVLNRSKACEIILDALGLAPARV
ncbi:MAG TPA: methylenetetrahydrofolate reductase [NAD(P)H] [Planctomycetaceae bacterium]|nr:methylenetetrahydrofolate reductase [NAD(P)H] [Planctomycetaceae bacterium]